MDFNKMIFESLKALVISINQSMHILHNMQNHSCSNAPNNNSTWTVRSVFNEIFQIPNDQINERKNVLNYKKFDNLLHHRSKIVTLFDNYYDIDDIYDLCIDHDQFYKTDTYKFVNDFFNKNV